MCVSQFAVTCTEECRRYTGEFCQSVGYTNTSSVLLRRQLKDSVSGMELELRGTLHKIHGALQLAGSELTPGCELVTRQLLCRGALPNCLDTSECTLTCIAWWILSDQRMKEEEYFCHDSAHL